MDPIGPLGTKYRILSAWPINFQTLDVSLIIRVSLFGFICLQFTYSISVSTVSDQDSNLYNCSMSISLRTIKFTALLYPRTLHCGLILLYKGLKGKARIVTDDLILIPQNKQWHFKYPLLVQTPINLTSFPKLSRIGMTSLIL